MLKILIAAMILLTGVENPDTLQRRAIEENKNIVIYFCGSDWCTICHQFKSRIIDEPSIKTLLDQKFIYYAADFPQRKKLPANVTTMNEVLADKLNKDGSFPKFVITDEHFNIKAIVPTDAEAGTALSILEKYLK